MASILVPVLYLLLVFGGLVIFSRIYRKRYANKRPTPWYTSHPERDIYVTLLQQQSPPASDALLKAALIRRAIADVHRVVRLREDKPALQALLQKGTVGDELWNSLLAAEKELEAELLEVMHEANTFVPGWGQIIFATASEMVQNEKFKALFDELPHVKARTEKQYNKKKPRITAPPAEKLAAEPASPPKRTVSPLPNASAPSKPSNGLAPPPVEESVTSSDGEAHPSTPQKGGSTPVKSTPKSSGKKGKRRK